MAGPCTLIYLGALVCNHYNALHLLNAPHMTRTVTELELNGLSDMSSELRYDVEVWPKLKELWVVEKYYTCDRGLCTDTVTTTNPPEDLDNDTNNPLQLTDVGLILTVVVSIIGLLVLYVCMEHFKLRRKFCNCVRRLIGWVRSHHQVDAETAVSSRDEPSVSYLNERSVSCPNELSGGRCSEPWSSIRETPSRLQTSKKTTPMYSTPCGHNKQIGDDDTTSYSPDGSNKDNTQDSRDTTEEYSRTRQNST